MDGVVGDGPADHAVPRMEKGDILKSIDGIPVESLAHAKRLILGRPGTRVSLHLVRPTMCHVRSSHHVPYSLDSGSPHQHSPNHALTVLWDPLAAAGTPDCLMGPLTVLWVVRQ